MGLLRATMAAAERSAAISSLRAKVLADAPAEREGSSEALVMTTADAEREVLAFMDAVQRRIGHDLHDGLGQILVGASLMAKNLEDSAPESLRANIARLSETINEAMARVQSIARGLAPICLDEVTVSEALRGICANVNSTPGVECTLDVDLSAEVQGESTKIQLCLIVQEAVGNAIRHGHASRIEIELQSLGARSILSVRDNGSGIAAPNNTTGLGLQSMHYRAHLLGGSLEVVKRETGGTLVRCVWTPERDVPSESATHRITP